MNATRPTPVAKDGAPAPLLCPLNRVRVGSTVIVRRLTASPEVNQRLREMGFSEDRTIKLISLQSTLLCQVCNSRLGLNSRLAESIWVEPTLQRHAA